MFKLALFSFVCLSSISRGFSQQQYQSSQFNPQQTTTTRRPYHPPAQVHYVNIGEKLEGDYKFGYDTGKGPAGQSFREEVRLPDGTVMGAYGYLDEQGRQRIVKYTAGADGFKVEGDGVPPELGRTAPAPQQRPQAAPVQHQPRPQEMQFQRQQPQPQPQPQQFQRQPQPQQYQPQPQQFQPQPQQIQRQPQPQQYQPQQFQQQPPQQRAQPQPLPSPVPVANPHAHRLLTIQRQIAPQQQYQPQQFQSGQQQPLPGQFQSQFARGQPQAQGQAQTIPEEENYGPPVIDAALLTYNIGVGGRN